MYPLKEGPEVFYKTAIKQSEPRVILQNNKAIDDNSIGGNVTNRDLQMLQVGTHTQAVFMGTLIPSQS